MNYESLPATLAINMLVQRVPELLGLSDMITSDQAAACVIGENPQSVLPVEDFVNAQPQRNLLETIKAAADDEIKGALLALRASEYNAGIDGLVHLVSAIQKDIRELARHFPTVHNDQADTQAIIDALSDADLLHKSRSMGLFSVSGSLDLVRNMLASEINRRRSHIMQLKRLGINTSTVSVNVARSIRSAVASAKLKAGLEGVQSVATIIRSTSDSAIRCGLYVSLMRVLEKGSSVPAGLPRTIDMCARRIIHSEHTRRCSQWNAQQNANARRSRVYITNAIGVDVFAAVTAESLDEQGKYIVDRKSRESRLLGVLECESAQAQILMAMYGVNRLLHIEESETERAEIWIARCENDVLLEKLRAFRHAVIDNVLRMCVVTNGACLTGVRGQVRGDASSVDIQAQVLEALLPELNGLWTRQ